MLLSTVSECQTIFHIRLSLQKVNISFTLTSNINDHIILLLLELGMTKMSPLTLSFDY